MKISTIGLDIAKNVFQVHGVDEAVRRPTMRFVGTKTKEQQSVLMLHKTRQLFVRQRTMLGNAIRGHLAKFGIIARKGRLGLEKLRAIIGDQDG